MKQSLWLELKEKKIHLSKIKILEKLQKPNEESLTYLITLKQKKMNLNHHMNK